MGRRPVQPWPEPLNTIADCIAAIRRGATLAQCYRAAPDEITPARLERAVADVGGVRALRKSRSPWTAKTGCE